eukprot:6208325-Pleurochrysis_carterae.AAC.2
MACSLALDSSNFSRFASARELRVHQNTSTPTVVAQQMEFAENIDMALQYFATHGHDNATISSASTPGRPPATRSASAGAKQGASQKALSLKWAS